MSKLSKQQKESLLRYRPKNFQCPFCKKAETSEKSHYFTAGTAILIEVCPYCDKTYERIYKLVDVKGRVRVLDEAR